MKYLSLGGLQYFFNKYIKPLVASVDELDNSISSLGNVRLNAEGDNGNVQINGYENRQLYIIVVEVGGKTFQVFHVGDTTQEISHYVIYGNGNLTYFWLIVSTSGLVRFTQSWSTNSGWISSPSYGFSVYQVMDIKAKSNG